MPTINMLSKADKVKGQGVASAYKEQVKLVQDGLSTDFKVEINKKRRADIMHYHTINLRYYTTLPFVKRKSATVGYVHFLPETVDNSLYMPFLFKKVFYRYIISFYKKMDHLVTVNPYFIKKLKTYGVDESKVTYIPNFVSSDQFYPVSLEEKINIRKKYNICKDIFVVLAVGQVQTRKGVLDFIEIAKKMPDIQFIWAGGFSFGPITDGYKELKKIMENPPANVRFLGIVDRDKMNEIYNMADIMFLPSYEELFPMTVLEAMNCKIPILLRDLDIYPDILFDFYLKASTINDFIDIIYLLSKTPEFYKVWQNQSYKGHKFYSNEHVLKMWEDFYKQIICNKSSNYMQ